MEELEKLYDYGKQLLDSIEGDFEVQGQKLQETSKEKDAIVSGIKQVFQDAGLDD